MRIMKVGDLARVFNGYAFKSSKYTNTGYKVIRITNVQDGYISNDNQKFIQLHDKSLNRFILNVGDILISLTGNVGRVGKVTKDNLPAVLNQRVGRLEINSRDLNSDYLFNFFRNTQVQEKLVQKANGIAQKNISASNIENVEIPLPNIEEQNMIVRKLDQADALRNKRKASINLLDKHLRSIFLEMFGDPVENPKKLQIIKFGSIIEEICYGSSRKSILYPDKDSMPILRIPNIIGGLINYQDLQFQILPFNEKKKLVLKRGDILFVRSNGNPNYIGRCAIFEGNNDYIFASYLIRARIKVNSGFSPLFVRYCFSIDSYKSKIRKESRTTAGNYNINTQGIKNFDLIKPTLDQQEKFIKIFMQTEAIKQKMFKQLEELDIQFQSLMQKSFSTN
jgi:type I restriction enzyme S subunit